MPSIAGLTHHLNALGPFHVHCGGLACRFVTLLLPGEKRTLNIAELRVWPNEWTGTGGFEPVAPFPNDDGAAAVVVAVVGVAESCSRSNRATPSKAGWIYPSMWGLLVQGKTRSIRGSMAPMLSEDGAKNA